MQLPQPSESFRWVQVLKRRALMCAALDPFDHLLTTREWTLGTGSDGEDAWSEVEEAIGGALIRVNQVHGADVLVIRRGGPRQRSLPDADIVVSNDPGVAIAVQSADCVPLLLADRRTGAVAAAHAGWRGLAAAVPGAAVDALTRQFSSRPRDLVAVGGPSIGPCCYEVGPDVYERFMTSGWPEAVAGAWFVEAARPTESNPSMPGLKPRRGHMFFDGARSACDQLAAAGVPAGQIFLSGLCTASHPQMLCSYRRDGRGAGRMAAAIRASIGREREVT